VIFSEIWPNTAKGGAKSNSGAMSPHHGLVEQINAYWGMGMLCIQRPKLPPRQFNKDMTSPRKMFELFHSSSNSASWVANHQS
jgi:hypothetical protein